MRRDLFKELFRKCILFCSAFITLIVSWIHTFVLLALTGAVVMFCIEEFLRLIQMYQILDQYQMSGRGYGQPLRISFHYSEKYYLQYLDDVHASTIRIIYLVSASLWAPLRAP